MQKQDIQPQQTKESLPTTLPITSIKLEKQLIDLGATITHPVKYDPAAYIDGQLVAFWV